MLPHQHLDGRLGWLIGILAILLSGWSLSAAPAPAGNPSMDVQCKIRTDENAGFLRLRAVASSDNAVSGRYRFAVRKQSASGSSQNVQLGFFVLEPGEESLLSTVYLDPGARDAYSAELVLDWDKGTRKCTSP